MRYSRLKKGMTWEFVGWFLFILLCLGIALYLLARFSGGSFNLIDKIFGWSG